MQLSRTLLITSYVHLQKSAQVARAYFLHFPSLTLSSPCLSLPDPLPSHPISAYLLTVVVKCHPIKDRKEEEKEEFWRQGRICVNLLLFVRDHPFQLFPSLLNPLGKKPKAELAMKRVGVCNQSCSCWRSLGTLVFGGEVTSGKKAGAARCIFSSPNTALSQKRELAFPATGESHARGAV